MLTKCEPASHASHASHARQTVVSSPFQFFSLLSAVASSHECSLSLLSFRESEIIQLSFFFCLGHVTYYVTMEEMWPSTLSLQDMVVNPIPELFFLVSEPGGGGGGWAQNAPPQ